ncbi:hypothetical protein JCGZ_05666 [Jatropha curcas]|uniref:Uncharacterized protein n=1 Tax=Jatropha curcas TaxID=180498 RepID=A0A067LIZ0_JATCU|nr:hypothetical protein JCGZ_05666 [Jatropha curcas]
MQYLGPNPGLPCLNERPSNEFFLDPSSGPVAPFCLLIVDPEQRFYRSGDSRFLDEFSAYNTKAQLRLCWAAKMRLCCLFLFDGALITHSHTLAKRLFVCVKGRNELK